MEQNSWQTFTTTDFPELSDLAAFTHESSIYVAGGFNAAYEAQSRLFAIDTTQTMATGTLTLLDRAPMPTARGDLSLISIPDGALVAGGFTSDNGFCQALTSVEQYNVIQDLWTSLPPLPTPRADGVLVHVVQDKDDTLTIPPKEHIFLLGGERMVDNFCSSEEFTPEEIQVAVDTIESLDPENNQWSVLDERLQYHRFRLAAVSVDDKMYTVGPVVPQCPQLLEALSRVPPQHQVHRRMVQLHCNQPAMSAERQA